MKIMGTESGIHEKNERRYRINWLRGAPHGHVSLVPYPDRMTLLLVRMSRTSTISIPRTRNSCTAHADCLRAGKILGKARQQNSVY